MFSSNVILIATAFVLALVFIYILYAIIMYQGGKSNKGAELQLSTKNILEQVKVLFDKNEFALVQLLATKYLDRVPGHKEVRQYLAKAYFSDKKYNNAINQCLIILKRDPNNINTRKLLGDCYVKRGLLNKAIKEFEGIYDQRSTDKEVLRTLAKLYEDTAQIYSAIAVYNALSSLLEDNEEIAAIQLTLAKLNEETKDYPAAFEAYKIRLGIYPTDIPTNQSLAELYIKIENYPKAIETLLYILTFASEPKVLIWAYENLIGISVETEEYEKAIEYSNRLLEVQGSDKFKIRNDIALFNIKLNNFTTGIAILEELVMMSQNGFDVTVQLADSYIKCKEYQKALDKYHALLDKATQKEAKKVRLLICDLYVVWAEEASANSRFDESFRHLDMAAEYNTLNPEIYYNKAVNHMSLKNYQAAVELLHTALEYDKNTKENHARYYIKLSETHHYLGNFFEEKKALSDLLKLDEKNPMGLYRSGLMYISQHDSKNAEENFKKALQYDPTLIPAKYNLALIYENNNRDRAKELYIEILAQDPSYEEARRALNDLASSDY